MSIKKKSLPRKKLTMGNERLGGQESDSRIKDILTRGVVDVITSAGLEERLKSGKPLRIKYGVDPTKPSFHIGHAVPLRTLRAFQELGHKAVIIIGDYTARIGDPGGRSTLREALTAEQVQENAKLYFDQVYKIIDKDKTEVHLQSEWYGDFDLEKVIRLMQHVTYSQLWTHETFRKRVEDGNPLYLQEMFYPVLQAYDSVAIKADVELGGEDQRFNFTLTRDLMRSHGQRAEEAILIKYLPGIDGQPKMSKSLGNSIDMLDSAADKYAKVMSIPDSLMPLFFELGTDVPMPEVADFTSKLKSGSIHPMELKKKLASTITRLYHTETEVQDAAKKFEHQFQKREVPQEMPVAKVPKGSIDLMDFLVSAGLAASKSEARRLLKQDAIKADGKTIHDVSFDVQKEIIIRVGSRRYIKLIPENE
jgi:tyrosyl-tRNA synthetase